MKRYLELVPSILTKSADEIYEKLDFLSAVPEISTAQIDFADGKFVPSELVHPRSLRAFDTRLVLEAHLMVQDPTHYFEALFHLGFRAVFIHFESFHNKEQAGTALKNARHAGLRSGLAINPSTGVEIFDWLEGMYDEALVMGVNPGLQGQAFIPETAERVEVLRRKHPDAIIEVDGGVKIENVGSLVAHGANKLNAGSGIWQSPDPKKTIAEFIEKLK
ncbi:MAG: Ribulose-phosphate 3-epimerase [Parcubacteria group bacterium GW2011_GWA2_51_12]|nr:MAG: Ribulose-phosphate 3-epimerase [Parcubacteria group bacterium GW2011_GWA2_51_12]